MIAIRPFTEEWTEAVRAFNQRIAASGFAFPEQAQHGHYLAIDGPEVRGGYILRRQRFYFRGQPREVAHYRLPLSEGIVDRAYATLGLQLIRHALKQQPLLYALGMGGFERPLPQMLRALGWNLRAVPFLFKVNRPAAFLRNIQPLRKTVARRMALDLAAGTGLGWLGFRMVQRPLGLGACGEAMASFSPWADSVWKDSSPAYDAIAERDADTLDEFYRDAPLLRLKVGTQGWVAMLDTQMRDDKYFGNLRLGSIADCLASPAAAASVIAAGVRFLERREVDLIISNQLHGAWITALKQSGFREGPSNFIFAASKALAELIPEGAEVHINRGDGDGPIHL